MKQLLFFQLTLDCFGLNDLFTHTQINKQERKQHPIAVYPNPTNNSCEVKIPALKNENAVLHVLDSKGKRIFSRICSLKQGENKISVSLETLSPGYFLQFIPPTQEYQGTVHKK